MGHDTGKVCLCLSEHRPAPLELNRHHIHPLDNGGPEAPDNIAWLCPTTHANVHELLRFMLREERMWSWTETTNFYSVPVNRYAYNLACEGFRRINL